VLDLQYRENWKISASQKGDDWSKTTTPDLFERLIGDAWPLLRQIIGNGGYPGEQDLFSPSHVDYS